MVLLERAHASAEEFVAAFQLEIFDSRSARTGGTLLKKLSGSSTEFHEHRPYQSGDDLRHVDWRASARLRVPIIKLFREEVQPSVDLVVDVSPSMFVDPEKAQRMWELVYVVYEICKRNDAAFRLLCPSSRDPILLSEMLEQHDVGLLDSSLSGRSLLEDLKGISLRRDAMKVLISDLLFPGDPSSLTSLFHPPAIFLAPTSAREREPLWNGNVTLVDCETHEQRQQFVSDDLLERYRAAYLRHFDTWKVAARRQGIDLFTITSEAGLAESLHPLFKHSVSYAWSS